MPPSETLASSDRLFIKSKTAISLRSKRGSWLAYSLGYRLAAEALLDSVLSNSTPREVAYSALFCYRHHFEMELKAIAAMTILLVSKISDFRGEDDPTSPKAESEQMLKDSQHDLCYLLDYCEVTFLALLPDQRSAFAGLSSCIRELSAHDPNSFAFRYPTGKMLDAANLKNLESVDLEHFKETAGKVSDFLERLRKRIEARMEDFDFNTDDDSLYYNNSDLRLFRIVSDLDDLFLADID